MKRWNRWSLLVILTLALGCIQPLTARAAPQPDYPAPETWQSWPVVPQVTETAREIYARGMQLGNDPHHFSKIGDCQGIYQVLMGIYDLPGSYKLEGSDVPLQDTIDNFRGSFYRDGFAVKGGFDVPAVFDPMRADTDWCRPGESPLECEFRVHRPGFVIVTLEYPYKGRTTAGYKAYIRQIIELAMQKGIVPILSTKADNMENDNAINLANAQLAAEYDLPLWNFWAAVQGLPNRGLDVSAGRDDGFHISYDAWTVRAHTALQALDSVWRGVRDLTPAQPEAQVPFPASENAGKLVLGLAALENGVQTARGVYLYDTKNAALTELLGSGYRFQDVAPDGLSLLASLGGELYRVSLADGQKQLITSSLAPGGGAARYLPDGKNLLLIDSRDQEAALYRLEMETETWTRLTEAGANPARMDGLTNGQVYWSAGRCTEWGACNLTGSSLLDLKSGVISQPFPAASRLQPSPDGRHVAYTFTNASQRRTLAISTADGQMTWNNNLEESDIVAYDWAPDGMHVAALFQASNPTNGKISQTRLVTYKLANTSFFEYLSFSGLFPRVSYSPDNDTLAQSATVTQNGSYALYLRWFSTRATGLYDEAHLFQGNVLVYLTDLRWVP